MLKCQKICSEMFSPSFFFSHSCLTIYKIMHKAAKDTVIKVINNCKLTPKFFLRIWTGYISSKEKRKKEITAVNCQVTGRCHPLNTHWQQKTLLQFSEPIGWNPESSQILPNSSWLCRASCKYWHGEKELKRRAAFLFQGNFSYSHPDASSMSWACFPGHGRHANNGSMLTLHLCLQLPIKTKLNCLP